jgi:hypothetical protein
MNGIGSSPGDCSRSGNIIDYLFVEVILLAFREVFKLKILPFLLHKLDEVRPVDELQMPDSSVFVPMFRAVFGINVLARVDFHFKLMRAPLKIAVHQHGYNLGVTVLKGLIFDVYIFGLGPFPNPIAILAMLGAILRNMNTEKDFPAAGIQTFFFAEFLPTPGFRKLHARYFSSGLRPERMDTPP